MQLTLIAGPAAARRAALATITASIVLSSAPAGAFTYYIDENLSYENHPPCSSNPDLNVVTASLQDAMDNAGWTGHRYTDTLSWPSDFTEACSSQYGPGGQDNH
jgi:hypothetical protein